MGGLAHCWGSEGSDPCVPGWGGGFGRRPAGVWGGWLFGAWPDRVRPCGVGVAGVGVLFEICIVDASIFVAIAEMLNVVLSFVGGKL